MKKDFKQHWKDINKQTNWKELAKVYKVLKWKWHDTEGTPTHKDLKRTAKSLVKDLLNSGCSSVATGGLTVKWDEELGDGIILRFSKILAVS